MRLHLLVLVFALWALTYTRGERSKSDRPQLSSSLSVNERVKLLPVVGYRFRRASRSMVKVMREDGTYVYRKAKSGRKGKGGKGRKVVRRVARGSGKKGKGYQYQKPGYVYKAPKTTTAPTTTTTTTTARTRLPPLVEMYDENSPDYINPDDPEPTGAIPSRDFFVYPTTTTTQAPLDPHDIRDNIPGEPGKDYKVHSSIPNTNFTCEGRAPGFYADPEAGCQVFHRCTDDPWYTGTVRVSQDSFLCPNGTLYNQQIYACDWWANVDCETAREFYQLNEQIGMLEETERGTLQYVKFGGIRVPPPPGHKKKTPGIIPRNQRKPLPEEYRTRKKEGNNRQSGDRQSIPDPLPPVSSQNQKGFINDYDDDPENLANKFIEGTYDKGFSEFSAGRRMRPKQGDEEEENIQTIIKRGRSRSKGRKSKKGRKNSKRPKTTTTTTPAPELEDEYDDFNDDDQDDDAAEEEDTDATNDGFIVNKARKDEEEGVPPAGLKPPTESKERKGSEESQRSGEVPLAGSGEEQNRKSSEETKDASQEVNGSYLPPMRDATTQAPTQPPYGFFNSTLIPTPPTTVVPPHPSQYPSAINFPVLPQGNGAYPPPPPSTYLPPQNPYGHQQAPVGQHYIPSPPIYPPPPPYPSSQSHMAYLPQYGPSTAQPPTHQTYPPIQSGPYLPPPPQGTYLPPKNDSVDQRQQYPPQPQPQVASYLPPQSNPSQQYLPFPQGTPTPSASSAYLPPPSTYLPPASQHQHQHSYLPPQPRNESLAYLPQQPTTVITADALALILKLLSTSSPGGTGKELTKEKELSPPSRAENGAIVSEYEKLLRENQYLRNMLSSTTTTTIAPPTRPTYGPPQFQQSYYPEQFIGSNTNSNAVKREPRPEPVAIRVVQKTTPSQYTTILGQGPPLPRAQMYGDSSNRPPTQYRVNIISVPLKTSSHFQSQLPFRRKR